MDTENELVEADNAGVKNYNRFDVYSNTLPPERKGHRPQQPPRINYNNERATQLSMRWRNLIVGARVLHYSSKAYINFFNANTNFVGTTPTTNIINNHIILTQYSIKQVLQVFKKSKAAI